MLKNKKMKRAFTLVEMMIVIIIIGILMAALLPKLKGAQERARDVARKANLSTISTALEMYFNDQGIYPTGYCINDIAPKLVPTYVSSLPTDPQKERIAYWTKPGWCKNWEYGYTAMMRKWGVDAWSVIVANTEAAGTVGNYILPQKSPTSKDIPAIFSWNATSNKVWGMAVAGDWQVKNVSWTNLADAAQDTKTTYFSDASIAEKFSCSKTVVAAKVGSWIMCNRVLNKSSWKAISNNSMVYAIFN